jgi:biotin carboxyl carrier protein
VDEAARPSSPSPEDASRASATSAGRRKAARQPAPLANAPEVPTAADTAAISRLIDEIMPLLIARFRAGRMGELEVRRAGWHVRVRRPADELAPMAGAATAHSADAGRRSRGSSSGQGSAGPIGATIGMAAVGPGRPVDGHGAAPAAGGASVIASSPGVGYFATRESIATGSQVRSGDVLGHVDVLGVRQEVVAPGDGIVARWLAEAGEAVEYGQDLVRLEPVTRSDPVREA